MKALIEKELTDLSQPLRHLTLVLGDQLDAKSLIWDGFDVTSDCVWMAEVVDESVKVASSKTRTAYFFSAMRHFCEQLRAEGKRVIYSDLPASINAQLNSLQAALTETLRLLQQAGHLPKAVQVVLPGDYRVLQSLKVAVQSFGLELDVLADQHFLSGQGEFAKWLQGRKSPVMEYWYRALRKRLNVLMDDNGKPIGGKWNYDADNRKSFAKDGPENVPIVRPYPLDEISEQVVADVQQHLDLVGEMGVAYWSVTREQALEVLHDFIEYRLECFGDYQDAMWQNQPWLFHSRLSAAINVKLLHPLEVVRAVERAYYQNRAPLNAVEGFIRQIIGWREYVRGLYWSYREQWLEMNALNAERKLPSMYWTGQTKMTCMSQSVQQVLHYGYGHHIQRLMVTGLFALLYGVKPEQIHQWYLAMYVDAVAWVEIPNTLGMSQFADGGIVGSKPYIASGAYISRMSNYCKLCPYDPKTAVGDKACPVTTLYWDFIARHLEWLEGHPRLGMQVKNWQRKTDEQQQAIRQRAEYLFNNIEVI